MPKALGGLGIMDTKRMNQCLMAKWIWRLSAGEQGLWADILRNKYLRTKDLLVDNHTHGSQFWKAIQKVKKVFRLGAKHLVGNGASTSVWQDWWVGSGPLCDRYLGLFAICADPEASIARAMRRGQWDFPWRRSFGTA